MQRLSAFEIDQVAGAGGASNADILLSQMKFMQEFFPTGNPVIDAANLIKRIAEFQANDLHPRQVTPFPGR